MPNINFVDMVRVSVLGFPGTGTLSLGPATLGFQTFDQANALNGGSYHYTLVDGPYVSGQWSVFEYGVGVYTTGNPPTLTRSVIKSSNGGMPINATATAIVWPDFLAEDVGFAGQTPDTVGNNLTATGVDQPSALVLTQQFNEVLTVAPGTGVLLPSFMATPGEQCKVASYGANALFVYPLSGQTFFSGGVSNGLNEPLQIPVGIVAVFETSTATTVYSIP